MYGRLPLSLNSMLWNLQTNQLDLDGRKPTEPDILERYHPKKTAPKKKLDTSWTAELKNVSE